MGGMSRRAAVHLTVGMNDATGVMRTRVVGVRVYVHHRRGQTGGHDGPARDDGHESAVHHAHCPPLRTRTSSEPRAPVPKPLQFANAIRQRDSLRTHEAQSCRTTGTVQAHAMGERRAGNIDRSGCACCPFNGRCPDVAPRTVSGGTGRMAANSLGLHMACAARECRRQHRSRRSRTHAVRLRRQEPEHPWIHPLLLRVSATGASKQSRLLRRQTFDGRKSRRMG